MDPGDHKFWKAELYSVGACPQSSHFLHSSLSLRDHLSLQQASQSYLEVTDFILQPFLGCEENNVQLGPL